MVQGEFRNSYATFELTRGTRRRPEKAWRPMELRIGGAARGAGALVAHPYACPPPYSDAYESV